MCESAMKLLSGFILCFLTVFGYSVHASDLQNRIVNGEDAIEGEYPYMVSVRYNGFHNCGGTIIGSKWVLTAAHCVYTQFVHLMSVLYGTIYLLNGLSPENNTVTVANAILHEYYINSSGHYNDIALLELSEYIQFTWLARPIKLPSPSIYLREGIHGSVVGWGFNTTNGTVMDILQSATIEVFTDAWCLQSNSSELINPAVHICAGLIQGGTGQCTGDSGGPLIVNGIQVGIVSWSEKPCASPGNPGVFVRVSNYISWIRENTGLHLILSDI